MGRRPRPGQRAQSLVEFALVFPVLLFLLFAVLEGGLLLLVVDSARYAAGEAARQDSESGTDANADTLAVQLVRTGPLGATSLTTVTRIDVVRLVQQPDGQLTPDATKANSYRLDGTAISVTWPPAARDVRNGESDFLGLTITYRYAWLSGTLLATGPLQLSQSFDVRLEPQTY